MIPTRPGRVAIAALALNAAWEVAHWPLYGCEFTAPRWARAATADAALTGAASAVAARLAGRRRGVYYALLTSLLVLTAAGIELHGLRRGRWCYRPAMPTIGPLGVSPLAQLPLAGAAAALAATGPIAAAARHGLTVSQRSLVTQ